MALPAPRRRLVGRRVSNTDGDLCDKGHGPEADPGSRHAVLFHLGWIFEESWAQEGLGFLLDLGTVYETAVVGVNGQEAGTVWNPPFELDIRVELRAGTNSLRIDVSNLLQNYLARSREYERPSVGPERRSARILRGGGIHRPKVRRDLPCRWRRQARLGSPDRDGKEHLCKRKEGSR
jgi:hypothetical protein